MIQICILNVNNFDVHTFDYTSLINSNEKIFNTYIDKYISFTKIKDNEDLMDNIIIGLKLDINSTWNGYTETIYETPNEMYQMIYVDVNDKNAHILCNENEELNDIKNMFACYLTSEKKNIHGKCFLIKFNCISNEKFILCDITYDDIIYILHRKIVHTCVSVKSNGNVKNIRFLYNPCESDKLNKYEICYTTFFDINILIYIISGKQNDEYESNEIANIFCEKKIYGDIFVSLLNIGNTFIDIDDILFNKIIFLFQTKQKSNIDFLSGNILNSTNNLSSKNQSDEKNIQNYDRLTQYRKILKIYSDLYAEKYK